MYSWFVSVCDATMLAETTDVKRSNKLTSLEYWDVGGDDVDDDDAA